MVTRDRINRYVGGRSEKFGDILGLGFCKISKGIRAAIDRED